MLSQATPVWNKIVSNGKNGIAMALLSPSILGNLTTLTFHPTIPGSPEVSRNIDEDDLLSLPKQGFFSYTAISTIPPTLRFNLLHVSTPQL